MQQIAIITDTHFGARNDAQFIHEHFARFYRDIFFPEIDRRGIKRVIHLGDVFDRRKYISFLTLSLAKDYFFDPLRERELDVHILVGNHDTFYRDTLKINSPELLLKDYPFKIYSRPKLTEWGLMLPWICRDNEEESRRLIESCATQTPLLFGHLELQNFEMYKGHLSTAGEAPDTYRDYQRVLTGHFHQPSTKGNISYLGSPYEITWSDYASPRGFHILNFDNLDLTFIPNPHTLHYKIWIEKKTPLPQDLRKIFRVITTSLGRDTKLDQLVTMLQSRGAIDVQVVTDHLDQTEIIQEIEEGEELSPNLLLLSQIKQADLSPEVESRAIDLANEIYRDALNAACHI